jgi:hypothetical protein
MNQEETALIEFLHWLEQTNLVTNKVKVQFTSHLERVGKLEAKSIEFIKHLFELAENRNHQLSHTLSQEWEALNAVLKVQEIPGYQAETTIAKQAAEKIKQHGKRFKRKYKASEEHSNNQAESSEQQTEFNQIAALKESLGV